MNIVERIKSWLGVEGSYRGPAVGYSHWGNPFSIAFGDGYQAGLTLDSRGAQCVPIAYACVMATAKAIATCAPSHMVVDDSGKHVASTTSPASRVLRKPNAYQTWPQFILNAVATELFEGEAFILILRDDRYAVREFHQMPRGSCSPYIAERGGEVFYTIGSNPMLASGIDMLVPARDVIHLRQHTPRHPLIGESPIRAAALALGVNVALSGNQAAFFTNMNRPSGILSTEQMLTRDQMQQLREAFDAQAQGMNAGKIPVLAAGLKFSAMGITSQDAQLIEAQRMSIEDVARCFGVPLPVIGDLSKATMNNVEAMINFWLATGLGSLLENLERSFDAGFALPASDYVEFDERALLRMDYRQRIDALTKAIQGGVMSPNEARTVEGLAPVKGGDTVFLQQQMISIDMLGELHAAAIKRANAPPPAPAAPAVDDPPDDPPDAEDKTADPAITRALVVDMVDRKRKAA